MKQISKKVIAVMLAGAAILFSYSTEARAQSQEKQNSPKMKTTEAKTEVLQLTIEGMSCQAGCANGIDNMLKQQNGVLKSKTLFDSSSSEIHYDENKISEKQIIALIEKKGFKTKTRKEQK